MTDFVIKTSGGLGSPGYLDDHAPNGAQWQIGGKHYMVPEGTTVSFVQPGTNANNFTSILIMDGVHKGFKTWVKRTHVVAVATGTPPPTSGKVYRVTGTIGGMPVDLKVEL